MTSETTKEFRKLLRQLPADVRKHAQQAYKRWQADPWHPALRFKTIHHRLPIYSVRIGIHWRAIGVKERDNLIWFWIGSHGEYNRKVALLKRQS